LQHSPENTLNYSLCEIGGFLHQRNPASTCYPRL